MSLPEELTIYDIAREAGVSPATVSRVLTNKARVSEKKQILVKDVIKKYNFRPNALARSLSDAKTRLIGLMVADIRNPYYATLAVECEKAAAQWGYTTLLCNILSDNAIEDAHLEQLYAQRVDAIIQIGCRVDDLVSDPTYVAHVNRISRTIPFIITGKLEGANCYCLKIDHGEAMKLVIDYLVSLGHRNIAMVGGEKRVESTYNKWKQYIYMLGTHKLPLREEYIQESNYSDSGGYNAMLRILQCKQLPTAVIAVNDYCAAGILRAVKEKGLLIPQDISLISFDNTFISEMLTPKLSSVDYNYPEYGKALIELAIKAVRGERVSREQSMRPQLIARNSCTFPPHDNLASQIDNSL
jgi:DNA-binding LacI/PurR family transcriptional regulator